MCKCRDAFTGTRCEKERMMCESSPCEHGVCINQPGGYTCVCERGYEGMLIRQLLPRTILVLNKIYSI